MCRGALQRDLSRRVIPSPPRREGSASRSCRGRFLKGAFALVAPACPEPRRAFLCFVRRAFCVPVALTRGPDGSCREARHPASFTFDLPTRECAVTLLESTLAQVYQNKQL